ncbi:hypothetical protein CA267_001160 [Alteromonas pelagimontana]|uniref:DUF695 domain-containing protein n=1 Tax=Alteromonas pelagimontana TaxID=1858656 RepID=A0A6M4M949_9ALTE|nr:hypothetical protein [Alteromonas pelagimontana]QJR79499.1 hypothetical protein CA267_001160 [Alteromonas pelagimontana]
MKIAPKEPVFPIPDNFQSFDIISINFRHFAIWLREPLWEALEGGVVEIQFPWNDSAKEENRVNRLNVLPLRALELFTLVQNELRSQQSQAVFCEANKEYCNVAIITPVPQIVLKVLQNLHCPDSFAVPSFSILETAPKGYLQNKSEVLLAY